MKLSTSGQSKLPAPPSTLHNHELKSLSVVIPAFNEEDCIQVIIERVLAVKPGLVEIGIDDLELIVVDDGSCDRTSEHVAAFPGIRLIRLT